MRLTIRTEKKKQVLDITNEIESLISREKFREGICHVFVLHTTCAITAADLDPGTDEDFLEAIGKMFPKGSYRHPHDPSHVGEHIMSSIIGPSISIPVRAGKLELGTWQRVVLVELSGPRERDIEVSLIAKG